MVTKQPKFLFLVQAALCMCSMGVLKCSRICGFYFASCAHFKKKRNVAPHEYFQLYSNTQVHVTNDSSHPWFLTCKTLDCHLSGHWKYVPAADPVSEHLQTIMCAVNDSGHFIAHKVHLIRIIGQDDTARIAIVCVWALTVIIGSKGNHRESCE